MFKIIPHTAPFFFRKMSYVSALPPTEYLLLCETNRTERQIKKCFCFYKHFYKYNAQKIAPGISYLATIHSYFSASLPSSLTQFLTHSSNNFLSIHPPTCPSIPYLLSIFYVPVNVPWCISNDKQNGLCSHEVSRLWGNHALIK